MLEISVRISIIFGFRFPINDSLVELIGPACCLSRSAATPRLLGRLTSMPFKVQSRERKGRAALLTSPHFRLREAPVTKRRVLQPSEGLFVYRS
jgi:hypothetical protein